VQGRCVVARERRASRTGAPVDGVKGGVDVGFLEELQLKKQTYTVPARVSPTYANRVEIHELFGSGRDIAER